MIYKPVVGKLMKVRRVICIVPENRRMTTGPRPRKILNVTWVGWLYRNEKDQSSHDEPTILSPNRLSLTLSLANLLESFGTS